MKNNKLLAKYLGFSIEKQHSPYWNPDKNWNQIMKVVETLEEEGKDITINRKYCTINSGVIKGRRTGRSPLSLGAKGETKIEAVYNACVEYLTNKG